MALTNKQKFLQQAGNNPASFSSNFRVPRIPAIKDSMAGNKLTDGLAAHDQAMEGWRRDLEKSIDERVNNATKVTQVTQNVTNVTSTPAAASTPSTPSPSISTTDDLPEGLANLYFTNTRWRQAFDMFGYSRNYIAATESIVIPTNRNLVVAGPLVIDGALTIDGILLMLPVPFTL